MDETYYTIDSRKLGFGEYWRLCNRRVLPFVVASARKTLGSAMNLKVAIPRISRLTLQEPGEIPAILKENMTAAVNDAVGEKLELRFFYTMPTLTLTLGSAAALVSADELILGQAMVIHALRSRKTTVVFNCCSKLSDGKLLVTASNAEKFDRNRAGYVLPEYLPGASIAEVCARHGERLAGSPQWKPVKLSGDGVQSFIVEIAQRNIDVKIASGLYIPMLPAEVERMRAERKRAMEQLKV